MSSKSRSLKYISYLAVFIVLLIAGDNIFHPQQFQEQFQNDKENAANLVKWGSEESFRRLEKAKYKNDFYQLINFYQPQINPLYCAAASSVIILNAIYEPQNKISSQKELEVKKPKELGGGISQFKSYSQINFFNDKTDKIKKRAIINLKEPKLTKNSKKFYDPGLTLSEMARILKEVYHLNAELTYAENSDKNSIKKFREVLKSTLSENKKFLIVNFDGQKIGLETAGHISPIAAYDKKSDSVLVLDVALHKNSWYFVPVKDLFKAMNTKDGENFRGYLILSSHENRI